MKKIITLLTLVVFTTTFYAQMINEVKAGFALSNITVSNGIDEASYDAKPGYYISYGIEKRWGEKIGFQVEAQYANLGAKIKEDYAGVSVTENLNFHRLLVPVTFRYYPTYELAVYAGGYMSTKISNKVKFKISGAENVDQSVIDEFEKETEDYLNENLKSADMGIVIGGDYTLYRGIFAEARYSMGLTNLIKKPLGDEKMTMNFVQFGLGYRF